MSTADAKISGQPRAAAASSRRQHGARASLCAETGKKAAAVGMAGGPGLHHSARRHGRLVLVAAAAECSACRHRAGKYHKEHRALRTETTINNTYDFGVGKRLHNLPKLRDIGFAANRRLLQVERLSFDCILAEDAFRHINGPVEHAGQRASGLRFADPRIHPLWHALILFRLLPNGFRRRANLRPYLAELCGRDPQTLGGPPGAIT
jgi:hypothetical protein